MVAEIAIDTPGANDRNWISIGVVFGVCLCARLSLLSQKTDYFLFRLTLTHVDCCCSASLCKYCQRPFSIVHSLKSCVCLLVLLRTFVNFSHKRLSEMNYKIILTPLSGIQRIPFDLFDSKQFLSKILIGHFLDYSTTHRYWCHLSSQQK